MQVICIWRTSLNLGADRALPVMLDEDLAQLYGVETKALLRAMRRNRDRFTQDFAFQLTNQEGDVLRSQIVTSRPADGRGGRRYMSVCRAAWAWAG